MWNEWLYIFLHTEYSYSNAVYVFCVIAQVYSINMIINI
jgi:hypothetical protein